MKITKWFSDKGYGFVNNLFVHSRQLTPYLPGIDLTGFPIEIEKVGKNEKGEFVENGEVLVNLRWVTENQLGRVILHEFGFPSGVMKANPRLKNQCVKVWFSTTGVCHIEFVSENKNLPTVLLTASLLEKMCAGRAKKRGMRRY